MRKIEKLAKLIGEMDNDELNEIGPIVKLQRKKLAHAKKLNLGVGMEVWFAGHNGVVEKINRTKAICREFKNDQRWTVPINMIEVA